MSKTLLPLFAIAIATAGCDSGSNENPVKVPNQPEIAGCTDIAGTNYSRRANKDDGSCTYIDDRFYHMTDFGVSVDPATRQVRMLMQVTSEGGRGVPGLNPEDFAVAENGRKIGVESDASISAETIPFSIPTVLLLDLSSSVEGLVAQIKEATKTLINNLTPNQRIAIYVFDRDTRMVHDFSGDVSSLFVAVDAIPETELFDSTNLYGSIIDVSETWQDEVSMERITDGSLVIFTDGFHNADPSLDIQDAVNAMLGENGELKKVYVAALNSPDLDRAPLQQLTFHTMGFFEAADVSGLREIFLDIQSEITDLSNSFYLLTYTSPITNPEPRDEVLEIAIVGNPNADDSGRVRAKFDSEGFGQ
ncbi:MAG: VWA domain-containing protein [Candidatus Latescibacterota bacterium]|nr:VWA domain-containing protein [Candidatus Latescibacterota bacterium]